MRHRIVNPALARIAATLLIVFLAVPMAAMAGLPKYEILKFGLDYDFAHITAISDAGHVTGRGGAEQAFLYSGGTLTHLDCLGKYNFGLDVNDVGQVAGYRNYSISGWNVAFIYSDGICSDLGTFGGLNSHGVSINNSGQVTGWAELPGIEPESTGERHAFLYSDGNMVDLGTLGGSNSSGLLVDEEGQVVGLSSTAAGDLHLFRYSNGTMNDLGKLGETDASVRVNAVNAAGQAVGYTLDAQDDRHAFLFSEGVMIDLGALGGTTSEATDINDAGQVTGWAKTVDGYTHAFLYSDGNMIDLGSLGQSSVGFEINNAAQVAGITDTPSGGSSPFIYSDGRMRDLWSLGLSDCSGVGRELRMNDAGQVTFALYAAEPPCGYYWNVGLLMTPISMLFSKLENDVTGAGPGKSLAAKILDARTYYAAENLQATCAALDDFASKVNVFAAAKKPKITPTQAEGFIEDGQAIQDAVGCP